MGNNRHHPSLQSAQVDGEPLAQLFEESQVQGNPTQCIKYAKHLTGHCAWGAVAITCEPDKSIIMAALGHTNKQS